MFIFSEILNHYKLTTLFKEDIWGKIFLWIHGRKNDEPSQSTVEMIFLELYLQFEECFTPAAHCILFCA